VESVNGKMKLIIPLLFLLIFISISYFRIYYKRQIAKLNYE
jgi:Flp pilus assembly protein TadG